MPRFVENESNAHKCAKRLLVEWLNSEKHWDGDGVFEEYPLVDVFEKSNMYNVIGFNYHIGDDRYEYYGCKVPSYEKCVQYGETPIAILDVAVVEKGCIKYGFEVCHKNPVSEIKKKKLREHFEGHGLTIFEIQASDILNYVGKPDDIFGMCETIIKGCTRKVNHPLLRDLFLAKGFHSGRGE
jgi:hypothetical protein